MVKENPIKTPKYVNRFTKLNIENVEIEEFRTTQFEIDAIIKIKNNANNFLFIFFRCFISTFKFMNCL